MTMKNILRNLEISNKGEDSRISLEINYESEEPRVLGRDLHRNLDVQTKYSTWFPRMIEYGFVENVDY